MHRFRLFCQFLCVCFEGGAFFGGERQQTLFVRGEPSDALSIGSDVFEVRAQLFFFAIDFALECADAPEAVFQESSGARAVRREGSGESLSSVRGERVVRVEEESPFGRAFEEQQRLQHLSEAVVVCEEVLSFLLFALLEFGEVAVEAGDESFEGADALREFEGFCAERAGAGVFVGLLEGG